MSRKTSKNKIDFSDMSHRDFAAMMMNMGIVGRESGHNVHVKNGTFSGQKSILIVLSGYKFENGNVVKAGTAVSNENE